MQDEIWKDIPGFEEYYQASNHGRIRNIERKTWNSYGYFFKKQIILKPNKYGKGYSGVYLYKNKIRKTIGIHVLVAMTFLNYKINSQNIIVHHKDNNTQNNHIDNLDIRTQRANCFTHHKGTSKYTGVSWNKRSKKWVAGIRINGNIKRLGYHTDEYEAHLAYQKELKTLNN
ncbi:MAG: NUMOD4 domain-containing protein [Flavobacteriaceae bacterium]